MALKYGKTLRQNVLALNALVLYSCALLWRITLNLCANLNTDKREIVLFLPWITIRRLSVYWKVSTSSNQFVSCPTSTHQKHKSAKQNKAI